MTFIDEIFQNPFSTTPEKIISFLTVGDSLYFEGEFQGYFGLLFYLHKTQNQGSRVVYDIFTLLSDVGGFMGSIQMVLGMAMSLLYLPKLFEADFVSNEKTVDRNKKDK